MNKEMKIEPLMIGIKELQAMTGLSKKKAMELGVKAGAKVDLGMRRTLYNVCAIQRYINSRTGEEAES